MRKGTDPMKNNSQNGIVVIVYVILLAMVLTLVWRIGVVPQEEKEKVGLITSDNVMDGGWSAITCEGLKEACQETGMDFLLHEGVKSGVGDCVKAVQALAGEGASMIILGSYGYADEMRDHLSEYPDILFYSSDAEYEADNLVVYSARMYQVRYLSGIIAGMRTKTDRLGFVAAEQSIEVCRGINAFALGVHRVNPDAEILVDWSGAWDDKEREEKAVNELVKEGVDVLSYHQNRLYVVQAAEAAGIETVGSYEVAEDASDKYLTCAACDWAGLYQSLLQEFQRGADSEGADNWLGLESNAVYLTEYSSLVEKAARSEVEKAKQEILSGKDVFTGVIYDNEGKLRCGEGEAMSDTVLKKEMDWLAEGVKVYGE